MNKEQFIDFVLQELGQKSSTSEKPKTTIGGIDLGFGEKTQSTTTQESLLRALVRHSGFSNQMKKDKHIQFQLQKTPINENLLAFFPLTAQVWAEADTGFSYTLVMIEFDKTAVELLKLNIFNNKTQVLDALQRVAKDVMESWWHGEMNKKEKMTRTLVALSIKDDVNQLQQTPHILYFSHYTEASFEYFYLTDEVKQWSKEKPQQAKDFIGSIYERHFIFLTTSAWKKAFITEQEQQNVQKLHAACFANETKDESIFDAAEALIREVSKDFLPENFKAIPLDNGHFIGANAQERGAKNFTNSLQGFGVEFGELVLGYCVVQRKDKGALAALEAKMSESNHLSNVLIIFIDKEEMVIQLWRGKQKLESKLGKNAQTKETEVNRVVTTIRRFFQVSRNIECSPQQLAEDLASKALLFKSIAERELWSELKLYKTKIKESKLSESVLMSELKSGKSNDFWNAVPLLKLYFTFHTRLMTMETSDSDKDRKEGFSTFSDVYAQTISYGLLAARWMSKDKTISFARKNIQSLLPSTSDFLKNMFVELLEVKAGNEVEFCIKELFSTLYQVNVSAVFEKEDRDPVIHFYEDFLDAYGKDIKKSRGVYYTPDEVVDFIVRSIDEQLKTEFGLPLGLASTKTWDEVLTYLNKDKDETSKVKLPNLAKGTDVFVRILDPATGTGTFIKRVLEQIRNNLKAHWKSLGWSLEQMQEEWKAYVSGTKGVERDYSGQGLLSRLNAFELMMAPYIITHLRMGLLLQEDKELPFEFGETDRLNVFLTNSLEHPDDRGLLFSTHLKDMFSDETNHADVVKRDTAITVVLGNPPYSGESTNKGPEIMRLMEDYKKEPGGVEQLQERNSKWINDDYVKFMRSAQDYLTRSSLGVFGYINPHGFLDNPTFRGVRWHLWTGYDKLYVLDLHGNTRKKETAPDGSKDENVFDIMQGVSINVFSKITPSPRVVNHRKYGTVYHADLYGLADIKYQYLDQNILSSVHWSEIPTLKEHFDYHFMVPRNVDVVSAYTKGFSVVDLFQVNSVGIVTARDGFCIAESKDVVWKRIQRFLSLSDEQARTEFSLGKDVRDWAVAFARKDLKNSGPTEERVVSINYRPFDTRYTYYTGKSKGFHCYPRDEVMQHFINGENIGLIIGRQGSVVGSMQWNLAFITQSISDLNIFYRGGGTVFPLKLGDNYNYSQTVITSFVSVCGELSDGEKNKIIDYIFAILYSNIYRDTFADFLSFDYPRIPYPKSAETFQQLAAKGKELRHIHLLEADLFNNLPSKLRNNDGSVATTSQEITQILPNGKTKKEAEKIDGWNGQIWINNTQYFEGVSELVWNFYIGGYQPAQKWLKDRQGRTLTADEVIHYSKIIKALEETDRIMKEIDQIDFL